MAKWDMKTEPADSLECIRYLRAQVETARDDALEEAAMRCEAAREYRNAQRKKYPEDQAQNMRLSPGTPSSRYRSCQRQTVGFDMPVRRMISTVPRPSAVASTISARQTSLRGVLRLVSRA